MAKINLKITLSAVLISLTALSFGDAFAEKKRSELLDATKEMRKRSGNKSVVFKGKKKPSKTTMNRVQLEDEAVSSAKAAAPAAAAESAAPVSAVSKPAVAASVASTETPKEKSFLSNIFVRTENTFNGPDVSGLDQPTRTSEESGDQEALWTRHIAHFGYRVNKQLALSASLDSRLNLTDAGPGRDHQMHFLWRDPWVRINGSNLISADLGDVAKFSFGMDGRYYFPVSKSARRAENNGSVRSTLYPTLEFTDTPFSISSALYARYFINTIRNSRPEWNFYAGPQFNVQLTDAITAYVLFEADFTRTELGTDNFDNPELDFEPGVEFAVTKNVTVIPYLHWFTELPLKTTSVALQLNIALF